MRPFFQRLALSVVTGVTFVYWSELAFWARPYAGTTLAEMAPTTCWRAFSRRKSAPVVTESVDAG
jgi:hypothetical protein